MPDQARETDYVPSGPRRGWGTIGFALVVTGLAGLLFHLNRGGVPIQEARLGQISLGLIGLGLVLGVIAVIRRATRR